MQSNVDANTAAGSRTARKAPSGTARAPGQPDAAALLRLAFEADPETSEGRAALDLARTTAIAVARDARRQAALLGGKQAEALERQARQSYYQAVIAEEFGNLKKHLRPARDVRPTWPAEDDDIVVLDGHLVEPPTDVVAESVVRGASVRWTPATTPATGWEVDTVQGSTVVATTPVSGLPTTVITGLTPGTTYHFVVRSRASILGVDELSADSLPSNDVVPLDLELPAGDVTESILLELPQFSSDPVWLLDPEGISARGLLADATRAGSKWRYEYLRQAAEKAARDTIDFEQYLAQMMSLAMDKLDVAEDVLGDTLLAAADRLQEVSGGIAGLVDSPDVDDLISPLTDLAAESLLLPRFLAWLVETSPVDFWLGLFDALIRDLASVVPFFGGDTDFDRTRDYLDEAFSDDVDGVRQAVEDAVQAILARLDTDVEGMVAPLRAAVDEIVGGTRQAVQDVFAASDLVLTLTPGDGGSDVPDVDPFRDLYDRLNAKVDEVAADLRERLEEALAPLLALDSSLFRKLCITYLVTPLLAFLIISLAGGPVSAALLAAVVLVAAQELIRLLVRWLTGPLLGVVDELKATVDGVIGDLQAFFSQQAAVLEDSNPEVLLRIAAGQLRQITDFLPQQFLEETATLLEEARSVVMRSATRLALAAEQAVGMENATAFDVIDLEYVTGLARADQLPGGRDPSRLAGLALLRDLGKLDAERIQLLDGKDLVVSHRLSLARLLGDDPLQFQEFLRAGEAVIDLDERQIVDGSFPGLYRALIDRVDVFAEVGSGIAGIHGGIPITLTHTGTSRTRVRRRANPAAPPLTTPDCFPRFADDFVGAVASEAFLTGLLPEAFEEVAAHERSAWGLALLAAVLMGLVPVDEAIMGGLREATRDHMGLALQRAVDRHGCGLVDAEPVLVAFRKLVQATEYAPIFYDLVMPADPSAPGVWNEIPDLTPGHADLAVALRAGNGDAPGLVEILRRAHREALRRFAPKTAKWAGANLVADRDPQVGALGYATLVRELPAETAMFNLLPPDPASGGRAVGGVDRANDLLPAESLQYRPLENRGVGGRLVVRVGGVVDAVAGPLSDAITDLVIDLRIRGVHDPDLAQTVRSSRQQEAAGLGLVQGLTPSLPLDLPGSTAQTTLGISEFRTVRFSLRAHRDRTLQVWSAAAQTATLSSSFTDLLVGKAVLGTGGPFSGLTDASDFALHFDTAPSAPSEASLLDLASTIRVTAADLGFRDDVFSTPEQLSAARLVSVGLAVVPWNTGVDDPASPGVDPLGLRVHAPAPLDSLLPGFASPTPASRRLLLTRPATPPMGGTEAEALEAAANLYGTANGIADGPTLAQLFDATSPVALGFGFGEGAIADGRLYDVLVSLTFRTPALQLDTPLAALT